ncbi:hypothetical protein ACFE04_001280 [Oxalis oulophora]
MNVCRPSVHPGEPPQPPPDDIENAVGVDQLGAIRGVVLRFFAIVDGLVITMTLTLAAMTATVGVFNLIVIDIESCARKHCTPLFNLDEYEIESRFYVAIVFAFISFIAISLTFVLSVQELSQ